MKVFSIIFFVILFFYGDGANAQEPQLNFTKYSTQQGLSSNTVNDILKDHFGFLWLATEDGLNRFDGTNFKVYKHEPENSNSLRVNFITSLYESKDGIIWIGTNGGGLSYYDRNKDSISNFISKTPVQVGLAITSINGDKDGNIIVTSYGGIYIINPQDKELVMNSRYKKLLKEVDGKVSLYFYEDSKQEIWVGTDVGLYMYQPTLDLLKNFQHLQGNDTSLAHNTIYKIIEDKQGNMWFATENGLSMLMPKSSHFRNFLHTSSNLKISSNLVYMLAVDSSNKLWVGTEEGLDILDIAANNITTYAPNVRNPHSLSSRSVRSILIDKQGICWVGTVRGGLNKYNDNINHFNLKEYSAFDPLGLRSPIVTSFAAYQNDVFVGTDGGGLQLYHRNTDLLDYIPLPISVRNNNHDLTILALEMTKNNLLWVGTYLNGLYQYNPVTKSVNHIVDGSSNASLNNNSVFCLKEMKNGDLWIGTNGGGINVIRHSGNQIEKYVFNPSKPNDATGPANNFIRSFEEDSMGNIWAGTFGSGISVFDPLSKKFSFYTKENSGLPSNYVLSIKEDSRGNIWVGTNGNGLGLLKKGSEIFEALTEKDGLTNGTILKIIEDEKGKIWVSTNNGLSCYDPSTRKFKNLSNHNGLQAGAFVLQSGLKLPDGELIFGGQNGFNHFNPNNLKTNQNVPEIVLTELKVDDQTVAPADNGPIDKPILLADEVKLKYKQGFSIAFEALDFTAPEANQYEYKLEGFDKNWVKAGKDHSAHYANIPPGNYVFVVKASNNDGVWNQKGRSFKVIVAPPFWRTIYAYFIYLLVFASVLFYIRHRGIKKIQMRYELEKERQMAKQLIERERKEAEYLHKLDQMKIKFLTNLSHEFRTPISLITGPIDNLIGQTKNDAFLSQLKLIKRNGRRLLNLVNQLLDFRKMEEKELKLQCSDGDIVFFIKDVCDSFNDLAKRKKIHYGFYTEVDEMLVSFDHDKVERVLFNILSNAFKFTGENGDISVRLKMEEDAEKDFFMMTVSVKDSGIGISKVAQTSIFDSFFQGDASSAILNHGTGIGLSITKEFVKLHGGSIWIDSEVGHGSTFTFQIKLWKAVQVETKQVAFTSKNIELNIDTNSANNNGTHPSVLIIEDDDDFRFYIKENLRQLYTIYEAPNGKEGWQRTLFHHPDVIISDVQMPIMNGLELVQKLKSDKRTKHIPVILLTAANNPNGTLDGLESGAIDYMTKPFDFHVLEAKIHNILLLNQSYKDTYSKQVTVSLPETEVVSEKDKFVQKTLQYIHENLDNPKLSVELLSSHLYISRASLYNKLFEYTGMTPVELIRSVKLEKAQELLEKSDLTVNEIAYETGFANSNYFSKVFRAKYNMTPSEFQAEKRRKG